MKKISLVIPCYNEEANVEALKDAITEEFEKLPQYDYEIIFIDNDSKDHTRDLIRLMAMKDPHVKGILNAKNFGQFNSPYYGLLQMTGDCVITLAADFQDPVDMIPKFLAGWEEGYKIVIGVKTKSKENPIIYGLRTLYYKTIKRFSNVEMIMHYTGFGLYDKLAKHAGAGTLVPITGFANAVVSPALEFKTEGYVLGVGAKIFIIAGPVIVYGLAASTLYGLILFIFG